MSLQRESRDGAKNGKIEQNGNKKMFLTTEVIINLELELAAINDMIKACQDLYDQQGETTYIKKQTAIKLMIKAYKD